MDMIEQLIDQHFAVLQDAIVKHLESPKVCKLAADFACEQCLWLTHYEPRERLFFLSDGEPYTADYIIKHMTEKHAAL